MARSFGLDTDPGEYGLVEMKPGAGGRKLRPVVKAEEFRILAAA